MKRLIANAVLMIATTMPMLGQVGTTTDGGLKIARPAPAPPVRAVGRSPAVVQDVPIYAIGQSGLLYWYSHQGAGDLSARWANGGPRTKVGEGWNDGLNVFKGSPRGEDGVIYRVDSRGDLYWYRHNGHATGSPDWDAGKQVGNGWQGARIVFAAGDGFIYVIDRNGDLLWYQHRGYSDGRGEWANQATGAKVGAGWGGVRLAFSGGNGVIYAVDRGGDLFWYQHTGYRNGTFSWAKGATATKVGNGWNDAVTAFSGGGGLIYAMKRDGGLYAYRHTGFATGDATWAPNTGSRIGTGWDEMVTVF